VHRDGAPLLTLANASPASRAESRSLEEKVMLGIVLMVVVVIGAFAAFWGLLHFTDTVIRRGHALPGTDAAPALTPASPPRPSRS
jgi:hypothetical protein